MVECRKVHRYGGVVFLGLSAPAPTSLPSIRASLSVLGHEVRASAHASFRLMSFVACHPVRQHYAAFEHSLSTQGGATTFLQYDSCEGLVTRSFQLDPLAHEGWHVTHLIFQRVLTPLPKPGGPRPLRELHNNLPPTRAAPGSKKTATAHRSPRPVRKRCAKHAPSGGPKPPAPPPPSPAMVTTINDPSSVAVPASPSATAAADTGTKAQAQPLS